MFSPLERGRLRLEERTWVPAMVPWRATETGEVTPELLAWYERFARGQPGALVVEATGIRDVPSGPLLRIGHDRFVPGLELLVETVRRASGGRTRLFVQLIDFLTIRRRPTPERYFSRYLDLRPGHRARLAALEDGREDGKGDEVRELPEAGLRERLAAADDAVHEAVLSPRELEALRFGQRDRVTDVEKEEIRRLPDVLPGLFASAARRALRAGFDGVELHYAHAYTMASFLSALNRRTDGWGGSREERLRLPVRVLGAVREEVGDGFVVGARMLTEDCVDGGSTPDDAAFFATGLARAGLDFLSLSRGGKFEDAKQPKVGRAAYPYTGPSGYECMPTVISDEAGPFGRNVAAARRVREAVRAAGSTMPTILAGGICTFDEAERLLETGVADVVAAARQSLADPDWFLKTRLGRGDDVRRCVYTNYCEGLDQMHKQVTCQLWDREDLEEEGLLRSVDGKRRLVAPAWDGDGAGDRG